MSTGEMQIDAAAAMIQGILDRLPDEAARQTVLRRVLEKRCRTCLEYDPKGLMRWCCRDPRD